MSAVPVVVVVVVVGVVAVVVVVVVVAVVVAVCVVFVVVVKAGLDDVRLRPLVQANIVLQAMQIYYDRLPVHTGDVEEHTRAQSTFRVHGGGGQSHHQTPRQLGPCSRDHPEARLLGKHCS